jgi:hypothetical protein
MLSGQQRLEAINNLMPLVKYGSLFRLVDESDAEFIFSLRTNPILSRYINKVSSYMAYQVHWISEYKKRESKGEEFYFISLDPVNETRQGLNRIYNFRNDEFELGSWLYVPDSDISKSILGDIAVREIAFDHLLFKTCTFEVRKENKSVIRYHNGFSPDLTGEDEDNLYFKISRTIFNNRKYKYLNIFGYGYSH